DIEDTSGTSAENDDPTVTILDQSPGIALIKEVISSAPYALDDTIEYQFTLSNEGDVTLTNIVFTDILNGIDLSSGLVWSESKANDDQLEVGEVWTATAIYIITQSDIDAGVVSNTAHVTSKDPNGNDIEDTSGSATGNDDPTVTILDQSPGIALIKEVISSAPYALDDTIEYQFTLSNEGDVTLTNIVFTDILNGVDLGSGLVWSESKAEDNQLEVGEVWTATAIYIITQSDIDAGVVSNTAHVTSKDPNGNDIEDTSGTSAENDDPTVTPITQNPALTVTKTAVESSFASVGDVLHYTIKVENTGNVTIINIEVTDDLTGEVWTIDELGPNDIYTVTTTYTITEDDLDAGNVLNHVIAFGKDPNEEAVEGEDEVNVPYGLPNVICPDDFSVCENEEQFTLTGGLPLGGTYYGAGVVGGADFNPAFADVGEHLITYEAITNSGIESCTFTITVLDSPDVTCPSDISICITTPEVVLTGGHPSGGVYSGTGVVSDTFVTADAGAGEHLISYTYVDVNGCENACDFVITVVDEPSVDAGPDIIICGDGPVEICGVVSNTSNFVWQVVGGNAMGTFDDDCSICTTFTPSEAALEQGFVIISLVVFPQSPCTLPRVDIMVITFSSAPTAFAGSEGSICYPDLTEWALTDASADHYSSLLWSSTGTGSFDDPSSLTPIYTVSAEDVLVGSVTLTLTAYPIEPCTDPAISSVALYIAPSPTVYAGIDTIICQFECCSGGDAGSYCLSAEAANYSSLLWSSSGDGTFADPSQLNTCYVIGSDDMVAGVVTLTLTAYPIEPCAEPVQSQILLTIQPAPIVDAGPDATICVGQTYTLSGSSALYSSSLYWDFAYMGEGDGVWDDHTVLHPTYTPGPGDLDRGYVTLILVGFGYDPCYSVIDVDVMKLYFESVPDVSFEAYPVCFGTEVSFINLSSSGTWLWDFGDGSTSDLKDPTHLYDAPGVYSVCLTVSVNTGCSDTFCGEVEVYSLPEVNAGSYPTLTIYDDITLQPIVSGATPLQFEWSPSTYLSDPQVERPIFGPAPLGVYTLTLTVTDGNGCSAQAETIIVVGPSEIIANDDIGTPVNGYDGGVVVANVLSNDLLNGSAPTLSLVDLTIVTPPSHSGIVLDLLTGEVTVAPGTPAGTYTFTYQICEILNPTNCDDALVTVVVTPPDILAVDDDFSGNPINGMDGGVAGNVLDNDLLNDDPVDAGDITISVVSDGGLTGVIIDSDGNLNVPPSTPAGTYTVTYEICEIINPTNCDQAVITIVVTASTIIANDDIGAPVNSDDGGVAVANVLSNDLLNGSEPTLSLVSLTIVTPPSHSGIVLDLLTGEVIVAAGTPVGIYTFTYQICEILNPTNCDDAMVTVVVIEDPAVLFCFNDVTATTGSEFAYCEGQTITVTLCDVLAGLAPFDICWEVNGSPYCDYGVGIDDILFSDQLPAGNYEIVITSITDSLGVNVIDVSVYHATVIVHADPSVEAGEDDVVCAGSSYELLGSLASNYSSLLWSGGDGVFSDPTALHPTYTLGANDLAVGSVTLCLSAEPLDPCTVPASDCLVLTIQDTPTVSLDSDGVICEDEFFALEPVVSNYSEVQWSGGVDGFFLDENDPFTSYYPGEEDIAAGSIELCIEVYAVSPCIGSVTACITLNIEVAPVANAGVNDTICEGDSYHLSTATATNYGSVEWLSSGDGTFDDNTVVNATYTPGEGDIANGSVILLLHAYPESVCTTVAESAMLLTIVGYPTLDMDSEVKLTCEDYDVAAGAWIPFQIDVVASNYGSVLWTTTGDGYFADPTDINSVYYVGLNDIWQPYFELCLTIEGVGACNASVSKCVTVEIPQQLIYYDQDGWWGLSSYLDPYDPPVPTVVDPIVLIPGSQHLITMVDRAGKYFWAEDIPPKNQLGDWKPVGYKIKMKNTPACLPIYGDSLTNQTFNISGLFTFLPVLTNVPVAITDLFADHLNKIRMIYDWPTARLWTEYVSDFDILQPGKAYLLVNKVTSNYSVTFPDYDPSAPHRYPTLKSSNYFTSPWSDIVNTAVPHVVVFDKSVQSKLCIGDVIGAFNHTGICYGSVEFNGVGEFMKLVVMGDAPFSSGTVGFKESEIIYFKLYRPSTGETFNLSFIYDQDFPVTDDHFTENGIARVVDFKSEAIVVSDLDLSNHVIVYPNPASTNLTVESSKPITNVVMLNSLGQRVLSSDIMGVTGVVDLNGLSRGMYVMHLYFEGGHHTIKRIIIE
ncbi:MAG TPA: PKD domain-containing protein, partial [Bacteroidales bacterium]|nr:PKD domain-containing protein [Bacteroidales bacterium]